MSEDSKKKGYLEQNFRLFHLKEKNETEFQFHYHEFSKIIIFLSGKVTYMIEGKAYYLKPWDILLVNKYDVHKPVIDNNVVYERIIIWVKSDYIDSYNDGQCNITSCFTKANEKSCNLIRLEQGLLNKLQVLIGELEDSLVSNEFGSKLLSEAIFLQFMVYLNRIFLGDHYSHDKDSLKYDKQVEEILKYINYNLNEDLSNEVLAEKFFLSKYHLMHKFKQETGYTLHNYITQKRLIMASEMIKKGTSISKAAEQSGFSDYSSFLRAYKKRYDKSPREIIDKNIY